jgi:adenylyltransferase/sulfurtransferase
METNYFARQEMILSPGASKLIKNVKILVIGAGAGGNEVLKNLLLMGFGNITIVDFDHIEDSNLSRTTLFRKEDIGKSKANVAAERLTEMALHESPNIRGLHGNLMTEIGKSIFWENDIVICCVDTQKARAYINDWCVRSNTPFFEMGFSNYDVDICFFAPEDGIVQTDGTRKDKLPSDDGVFPKLEGEFPVCLREVIGVESFDEKRNTCSGYKAQDVNLTKIPTIQVSAAMAGVLVAMELIKYLDGKDTARNKMLMFFGRTYRTDIFNYQRNPACHIHEEKIDEVIPVDVEKTTTLKDFIQKISNRLNAQILLYLPEPYIISGKCHICGKTIEYNKHHSQFWDNERWCEDCRNANADYEHIINQGSDTVLVPTEISLDLSDKILERTLLQVGIPENDVLKVLAITENDFKTYYITNKTK